MSADYLALADRLDDVDGDPLSNAERAQAAAALRAKIEQLGEKP